MNNYNKLQLDVNVLFPCASVHAFMHICVCECVCVSGGGGGGGGGFHINLKIFWGPKED